MKTALLVIIYLLACLFSIQAQTLYSPTYKGGNNGTGAITKFVAGTNEFTSAWSFESIESEPIGNVIQASDGKLYGIAHSGDVTGHTVIYSIDPLTSNYTKLKEFGKANSDPSPGYLMQAKDGKLYGTYVGGFYDDDFIFSFDPLSLQFSILKQFDNSAWSPSGRLIQATDGKLYGVTSRGGPADCGVIYSFDPVSSIYTNLRDFKGKTDLDGRIPAGNLIQASNGKLYGLTTGGGTTLTHGTIFSFDPSTSTYTKLKDFNSKASSPTGSLVQGSDGKLYGTTRGGGINASGTIFSFDPKSSSYKHLVDFDGINGGNPWGDLVQANDGKLYGLTPYGGTEAVGVVFSFDPAASIYKKILDFDYFKGTSPYGSLIQASDGKLYGTTADGGIGTAGVIFSVDPSSYSYAKLKQFGFNKSGSKPVGLAAAKDGMLYGVTDEGGSYRHGVIFSFDPGSSTYTKRLDLASFTHGKPLQANDGKLYGIMDGYSNYVIYRFDPSSSTITTIVKPDSTTQLNPNNNLIQARDGKLYGTTQHRWTNITAAIFSLDPVSLSYTDLKTFDNEANGGHALGPLIQAADGKLYGLDQAGSTNNFNIFSFDPVSSTYLEVFDFGYSDGTYPSKLIPGMQGQLYGTTFSGGKFGMGVLFSFDPLSSTYTKLKDFDLEGTNGNHPVNIIQASDGKLYGMTYGGGADGYGVLFSYDPATATYTKLKEFDRNNGSYDFIELKDSLLNTPPFVILTSPAINAIYTAPATISLTAAASDADGSIKNVKFYNGGTLLSTDSTSPYNYLVNNVKAGHYLFVAKATDSKGLSATSESIGVTVLAPTNKAPRVVITSPQNNAVFTSPASIIIKADAADSDGTISNVKFYRNGTLVNTDSTSPYSYPLSNVAAGSYLLVAKAIDDKGLQSFSASIVVSVSGSTNKSPTVKITSPAKNAVYYAPAAIVIDATASDADGTVSNVKFYSGAILLKTDSTFPYNCTLTNPAPGSYTIVAKVTDNKGLSNSSSSVTITIASAPNTPPAVNIISPVSNSVFYLPAQIQVNINATDADSISDVKLYSGANLLTTDSSSPYNFTWNNVPPGNYSLIAKATDKKGLYSSSASVYVRVIANKAPVISITTGNSVYSAPATVAVDAHASDSDGTIRFVRFYDGITLLNTDSTSPFSFSWNNVPAGSYSLTATATDDRGLTSTSPIVPVTVLATETLEAEDADLHGPIVATASAGFTGRGYADCVHDVGDYIEWTANTSTAGTFSLQFRYANGGANRPMYLQVNGVVLKANLDFVSTGGWTTWSSSLATARLIAGTNKIRLTTNGLNGPNVDNLFFTLYKPIEPMQRSLATKSITNQPAFLKAMVSPNPVTTKANLVLSGFSNLPVKLRLVDMLGKSYQSVKFINRGSNYYDFSVADLASGTYIIIVKQGELSAHARLIVGK